MFGVNKVKKRITMFGRLVHFFFFPEVTGRSQEHPRLFSRIDESKIRAIERYKLQSEVALEYQRRTLDPSEAPLAGVLLAAEWIVRHKG